jgi:hypothetical protein
VTTECGSAEGTDGAELSVLGLHCDIYDEPEQAAAIDAEEHLLTWPGDPHAAVDRFDARLLLDGPAALTQSKRTVDRDLGRGLYGNC